MGCLLHHPCFSLFCVQVSPVACCSIKQGLYLQPEEVAQMLRIIHDNFDNAYVMMETTSPFWVRKQSIEKSVQDTGAVFTWGVNRFSEMQNLAQGFHSVKDDNILRGMAKLYPAYRLISWLPMVKNMAEKILIFQKN